MTGLEGTTLGRYHLLQRLGSGGMSEVYLAHDERMNRDVAIKVVSESHADYLERFHREAEAIGRLNHDHILPAFDYGDQAPWHYLVMPYIDHETLRERLEEGPLTLEDAGEMLEQIASALQYAHDHGIIHRDIKPSNILLRDDHYAYLADFGLAKSLEGGSELTQIGSLLGTPEYMAPDLAEGPATTSSDVYALGVLLYQMLTGQVPFHADTPIAVYWKQIREQPLPPSHRNPTLPRSIDQVLLRALEKDPRRRFQTPRELADAYRQAQQGLPHEETMPPFESLIQQDQQGFNDTPVVTAAPSTFPPRQRFTRKTRAPKTPGRLILPGDPVIAPSSVPEKDGYMQDDARVAAPLASMPPLPMRSTGYESDELAPAYPSPPPPRRTALRRRNNRRGTLLTSIIVLGLLIFIVLPLSTIYYIYNTTPRKPTPTPVATATVNGEAANATATAAQATQQAQAKGANAATATAQASQQAAAKATATAAVVVNATGGTPFLTDSLASNTNGRWVEDPTSCVFTGGTYHVNVTQTNYLQPCALLTPSLDNATIQVDVSLLSGNDVGMLLRVTGEQFYGFEINNQGQFFLRRHDTGAGGNYTYLVQGTSSGAIARGSQKNTLLVIANADDFKLYINGTFVGEAHDSTYTHGRFALAAGTLAPTTVGEGSFANLKAFKVG